MDEPHILYIEDNLDNQRLVQRVLQAKGYTLMLADDGPSGLALAREHTPLLILVDIGIDGLDGYEVTTRLRSMPHLRNTPIIALTADNSPGARERALVAGCDGFLSKPIDPRQLPNQLSAYIAGDRDVLPQEQEIAQLREYNQRIVQRLEQRVNDLSRANAELQELDHIKSQFLSSLSHELRTPLTSLLGFLELFMKGTLGPMNEAQNEAINVMSRNVESLNRQIGNLLYLQEVRTAQLNRAPVAIDTLLQRLISEHSPAAQEAGISLIGRGLEGGVPPYMGDFAALDLAFGHIIENVIRFTPEGGRALVEVQSELSRLIVRIADTGIGIPEHALEKVFLPFYQVDNSLRGTSSGNGLGLTIVRHVIEAHNGRITVRSVVGKGTIFTVILPR